MPDADRPLVELSVFAAALVVAGLLALLQRRPERIPEWPPSPPRPPRRRQRVAPVAAGGLLLAGVLVGALVSTAAALEVVKPSRVGGSDADAVKPRSIQAERQPARSITDDLPLVPAGRRRS